MKKDTVNIIIGDSITYGVGDTEYFGWVNRLKKIHPTDYYFNLGILVKTLTISYLVLVMKYPLVIIKKIIFV